MQNFLVIAIVALILGSAIAYIRKEKRRVSSVSAVPILPLVPVTAQAVLEIAVDTQ